MTAVIFAGPSVAAADLQAEGEIEVLPPVRRGDIEAVLARDEPPTRIGIVDGEFMQSLMISPKEIARPMENGRARFYGSSSIGALRAVELSALGMVGIGRVFQLYATGAVRADDEVAMVFDADSMRALSEPMVNIRVAIAAARERGIVSEELATMFLSTAKQLYYPDRTYQRVLSLLAPTYPAAELDPLRDYLAAEAPNAKREDAVALARRMVADGSPG